MHGMLGSFALVLVVSGCAARVPPGGRDEAGLVRVRPGLEVLIADSLDLVLERRVGLVTNQAGVDEHGIDNVARLLRAGVNLTALFSPEHGFRGTADPGAAVASSRDSATGLPIYSLYGRTSAPTDTMLRDVDLLLVDLQDVGARYYTYLSTTVEVMRAAAARGLPVIVLDRIDPIGGAVQGNVLEPGYESFVGLLPIPMRHGMTLGELARLARSELGLDTDLRVIPVDGWTRSLTIGETTLPFIPPSPNLRTIESLFHYPGLCLFEGTNLSVGRGSEYPFEQIGAPWLDTTAVLDWIRGAGLQGVRFEGVSFTPRQPGDGKFPDTTVAGIRLHLTDRATYDPTATAVHLLAALYAFHADRFTWIEAHFDRLAGGPVLRHTLQAGEAPEVIVESWEPALERFRARRREALLYPESDPAQLP